MKAEIALAQRDTAGREMATTRDTLHGTYGVHGAHEVIGGTTGGGWDGVTGCEQGGVHTAYSEK